MRQTKLKAITMAAMLMFSMKGFSQECPTPYELFCHPNDDNTVTLQWAPIGGVSHYQVILKVNDPNCCTNPSGAPATVVLNTSVPHITIPTATYPCFSWQVVTVCSDDNMSAPSEPQCSCAIPPGPPCNTFDGSNPGQNWTATGLSVSFTDINALDGTHCVTIGDQSGTSNYKNFVDYADLGQNFLHQCLCFDYAFVYADGTYGGLPYHPAIYLSDGVNTIAFVANLGVNPDNGNHWYHFCAPIEHCTGGTFPSNTDGSWVAKSPGVTCDIFNSIMDHPAYLLIHPDINPNPSEEMSFDNICVEDCDHSCNSDFRLETSFNTSTNQATASVQLFYTDPNASYNVNWGDGTGGAPNTIHYYTPGSYTVCVTETMEDGTKCKTCQNFCFKPSEKEQSSTQAAIVPPAPSPTMEEIKAIGEAELNAASGNNIISPNPAKDYAEITLNLAWNTNVAVIITDMQGNVISKTNQRYDKGVQKVRIDTKSLANGMYMVRINYDGREQNSKLSIVK